MEPKKPDPVDWLVLLYVASDDLDPRRLEAGTIQDECNRMMRKLEQANIDPKVAVVALTDDNLRLKRPNVPDYMSAAIRVLKDGKWVEANLDEEAEFLFDRVNGRREIDSGSPRTLAYFLRWARRNYQAEHIMLSIVGHGGGWSNVLGPERDAEQADTGDAGGAGGGGGFQSKPGGGYSASLAGLCPDLTSNTAMSTSDLRRALGFGLGGRKLDVLFLDACLMGMIEIAYEFREQCRYLVAGESLLWAQLPYDIYLEAGNLNSNTSPAELADSIVRKYNSAPRRVQKSWAIAAIKLALIDELQARVEQLAGKLSDWLADDADRAAQAIVMAYSECQQFDDNADFRMEAREGYVDLIDFAAKLARRMKDSRQSGNQANLDVTASIIDGITNSLDKGGIVPPRTTSQGDQAEPAGAGERQGARGSDNQRRIDPDKPIFAVLAQTDENPPITEEQIIDLNHAKGLSIYLPIGDMIDSIDHVSLRDKLNASLEQYKSDLNGPALAQLLSDMVDAIENAPDKDNDISAREALDLHLARYSGQLLFTQATPSWVKLLEQLRTVLETMGKSQPDNLRNLLARSDSVRVFNRPRQRT